MLVCVEIASALDSRTFCQKVHPVCTAPQRNFSQYSKIVGSKEINGSSLRLIFPIDISICHALQQLWLVYGLGGLIAPFIFVKLIDGLLVMAGLV